MPRFEAEVKLDFKDVLIRPKRSTLRSRSDVDLTTTYRFKNSKREWTGVPIIAANMDTVGTFEMAAALGSNRMLTALHKFHDAAATAAFLAARPELSDYIAVSSGTSREDSARVRETVDLAPSVGFLCLDVANGYSEFFIDHVRKTREEHPRLTIMAGNVVTGDIVEELLLVGADIVKVGIGPGSVCTTRKQAGVGYPQLSAIFECADAAHGLGGHVIGDGGITCPGDAAKAFGGGGDFVMLGGMLAGHDESSGDVITKGDGRRVKAFYGMSSTTAMKKYSGGVAEYRSSEGKAVEVPYRGPVALTVLDLLGGLRSACTYVGAARLVELAPRTTFIRVNAQLNEVFRGSEVDMGYGYAPGAGAGGAKTTTTSAASTTTTAAVAVGGAGGGASAGASSLTSTSSTITVTKAE